MTKKKVKVKVKKRRVKIKRILIFCIIVILIGLIFYYVSNLPIKNIYIIGNSILSDKEIIGEAGLSEYPSFLKTTSGNIKYNLEKNMYIKDVKVKKQFYSKLYIYVTEKKALCTYNDKLLLEDGSEVANDHYITDYPLLSSDISSIKDKFVSKMSLIDDMVLLKISEIEYSPNDVDDERFVLKMNDGNLVYITLNKIEKINKYNSIYASLEEKKGIVYLDSGDYVEVREE